MHSVRYRKMLKDELKIHMAIHQCNVFMQDDAPCYRLKFVNNFFQKNNIQTLDWPGNIPDLNPIENFVGNTKRQSGR